MRKYIENQLKHCNFANVTNYDKKTNTILIPRYSKPKYNIGACYLIKFSFDFLNNQDYIITVNWNSGRRPTFEYAKACVTKIKGKMIYIDCLEYSTNNDNKQQMWSGWVSVDDITQISII